MGGQGSGRLPNMQNLLKPEMKLPMGNDMFIPNFSGLQAVKKTDPAIEVDWTISQAPAVIHADNYTDTNTTYVSSDFTHDDLTGFVANEHIDWTVDQGATNIHAGNYTDTNTTAHASFSQLDYASAGHTGFAPALGADDNYVTDVEKAALHTQNTDTALGSGAEAADHGTAATDQVVNVCYGIGDPPEASTTTEGAVFLKYTA